MPIQELGGGQQFAAQALMQAETQKSAMFNAQKDRELTKSLEEKKLELGRDRMAHERAERRATAREQADYAKWQEGNRRRAAKLSAVRDMAMGGLSLQSAMLRQKVPMEWLQRVEDNEARMKGAQGLVAKAGVDADVRVKNYLQNVRARGANAAAGVDLVSDVLARHASKALDVISGAAPPSALSQREALSAIAALRAAEQALSTGLEALPKEAIKRGREEREAARGVLERVWGWAAGRKLEEPERVAIVGVIQAQLKKVQGARDALEKAVGYGVKLHDFNEALGRSKIIRESILPIINQGQAAILGTFGGLFRQTLVDAGYTEDEMNRLLTPYGGGAAMGGP